MSQPAPSASSGGTAKGKKNAPTSRASATAPAPDTASAFDEAFNRLQTRGRIAAGERISVSKLTRVLRVLLEEVQPRLTNTEAPELRADMGALATVLENVSDTVDSRRIETSVEAGVKSAIADITARVEAAHAQIQEHSNTAKRDAQLLLDGLAKVNTDGVLLKGQLAGMEDKVDGLTSVVGDLKDAGASIKETAATYKDVLTRSAPLPSSTPTGTPSSADDARAMARAEIRAHQFLFDYPKANPESASPQLLPSLTATRDLVKKAIDATVPADDMDVSIKSLTTLANGGVLLELGSVAAVEWIRDDEGRRSDFEKTYGHGITIKARLYMVIVRSVPVHLDVSSPDLMREWEEANDCPTGSFSHAVWHKSPSKRHAQQTIAYARLYVTSVAVVNNLLERETMLVSQRRVGVFRDEAEPTRCFNCNLFGHFASACQNASACGHCAGSHETRSCTDKEKKACAACKADGHSSFDRGCPTFKTACERFSARRPGDRSPFYYDRERPWTRPVSQPSPVAPVSQYTYASSGAPAPGPAVRFGPGGARHPGGQALLSDFFPGQQRPGDWQQEVPQGPGGWGVADEPFRPSAAWQRGRGGAAGRGRGRGGQNPNEIQFNTNAPRWGVPTGSQANGHNAQAPAPPSSSQPPAGSAPTATPAPRSNQ
jgi:hypothetical protein